MGVGTEFLLEDPLKPAGLLQVVLAGTAMAGTNVTVTSKSAGEASSVVSSCVKGSSSANTEADRSSDWTIPASRSGAEAAGAAAAKKLSAPSKRGGLRHGQKLDLAGANIRAQELPVARAGNQSRSVPEKGALDRADHSSRPAVPATNAPPSEGNAETPFQAKTGSARTGEGAAEELLSRKRPGLRPSERSVVGVMNAARPAGKLRLLSRATQPSAGGHP